MDYEMYKDCDGEIYTIEDAVLDDLTWDIYEEFRAEDEVENQADDADAVAQYNEYYAGLADDEYGKQFVEYEVGCEQQDWRDKEEAEYTQEEEDAMDLQYALEQQEEEEYYKEMDRKWYEAHPEYTPSEV